MYEIKMHEFTSSYCTTLHSDSEHYLCSLFGLEFFKKMLRALILEITKTDSAA
jgi:hypothetical protein